MFQDHDVIFTLSSKPIKRGDAGASSNVLVNMDFVLELEVIIMNGFKLDSNIFP
jgi:hypothetical protein